MLSDLIKQLLAGKRILKSLGQPPQIRINIRPVMQFVAIPDLIYQPDLPQLGEHFLREGGIAQIQPGPKLLAGPLDSGMLVEKEEKDQFLEGVDASGPNKLSNWIHHDHSFLKKPYFNKPQIGQKKPVPLIIIQINSSCP